MSDDRQNRFQIPLQEPVTEPKTPLWIDLFAANSMLAAVFGTAFRIIFWIGVEQDQPPPLTNVIAVMLPLALATGIALRKRLLRYRALRIAAWLVLSMAVLSVIASVFSNAEVGRL